MWHEITHPFPNISGAVVDVWEWISNYFDGLTVHGSLQGPKKNCWRQRPSQTVPTGDRWRSLVTCSCWQGLVRKVRVLWRAAGRCSLNSSSRICCFWILKTWMGFVRQIFMKWETSWIQGYFIHPFEILWAVINASMQWPLSNHHSRLHSRRGGLCGSAAMCLNGGIHTVIYGTSRISVSVLAMLPKNTISRDSR